MIEKQIIAIPKVANG